VARSGAANDRDDPARGADRSPNADRVAERTAEVLRLAASETQLTIALGKLLADNEGLAAHAVRTLVALGKGPAGGSFRCPGQVAVVWENPALGRGLWRTRKLGRVDWRFVDRRDPTAFHVVVEVKIDHRLGNEQLSRYLQDRDMAEARLGGVAVLSKNPLKIDPRVQDHPKFIGAILWEDALPPLLDLRGVTNANPVDRSAYAAILRIASRAGDLSLALPDRRQLAASHGARAERFRSEIVRAALADVMAQGGFPMITAVRHRKDTAALCVSTDRFRALDLKLEGSAAIRLTASFAPPKPPLTQRKRWEKAIHKLRQNGWEVRSARLVHGGVTP